MRSKNNTISASDFKKHCLSIMDEIKKNKDFIIVTKHKDPMVKVTYIDEEKSKKSAFGIMKGMIIITEDIVNFSTASDWEMNSEEE